MTVFFAALQHTKTFIFHPEVLIALDDINLQIIQPCGCQQNVGPDLWRCFKSKFNLILMQIKVEIKIVKLFAIFKNVFGIKRETWSSYNWRSCELESQHCVQDGCCFAFITFKVSCVWRKQKRKKEAGDASQLLVYLTWWVLTLDKFCWIDKFAPESIHRRVTYNKPSASP